MKDEDFVTLGCFARVLINLWGVGAVYALIICIVEKDLGRFREPSYGMPAMLAPLYMGYVVVRVSKWCRSHIKSGVAITKVGVETAKGCVVDIVRHLNMKNGSLIVSAIIIAIAIIVFAFVHREPRYKPLGDGNIILDTHTGKTSPWYEAPEIFPKADRP